MKKPLIICVDDEQIVLNTLDTQLKRKFGDRFHYEFAESAEDAIEIIEELAEDNYPIIMVISDQLMPGMAGDQFLIYLHKKYPKTIKILLTGHAGLESAINAINNADLYRYLTKPWDEEDFLLTIEEGTQKYYLTEEVEKQVETFCKFVPRQFLECLSIKDLKDIQPDQARQFRMSIIFADIREFTHLSESMTPKENFEFLNNYFAYISKPIDQHHGFIDKFIGDGIMALFNRSALDAVNAAIDIRYKVHEYNGYRKKSNYQPIKIGIGINTGDLILGTVGSEQRIDTTVIGDAVNVASRIESLTKTYQAGILISENTYLDLGNPNDYDIREIDFVRLRGKDNPIKIYEVFDGDEEETRKKKEEQLPIFREGVDLYRDQQWDEAVRQMAKSLSIVPEDKVAQIYLERCWKFKKNPPAEDWDGSITLHKK